MHHARPTISALQPLALLACLAACIGGCGYHNGEQSTDRGDKSGYQWRSLYRQDVQTIAVPIFQNRTFWRGVEVDLTTALVQQIESQSPYKVVPEERADTVLYGEIVNVDIDTISANSRSGVPQEQLYKVRVNLTWKDLRNGRILVERRNFEQTATFHPTFGESRFVGQQLSVEGLAAGIAQELQADW